MTDIYWNDANKLKLISLVKKYPTIWNKTSQGYYDNAKKDKCWNEVAKEMKLPPALCKEKYYRLRQMFNSKHKLTVESPNYKSNWKYFEALRFGGGVHPTFDITNESEGENIQYESSNGNEKPVAKKPAVNVASFWKCENTIELINLVHSHRVLWDENDPYYTDEAKQDQAWAAIMKRIKLPLQAIKDRFNSLVATYNYERKQIAQDPMHVIAWFYFTYMEFLPVPKKFEGASTANLKDENQTTETTNFIELDDQDERTFESSIVDDTNSEQYEIQDQSHSRTRNNILKSQESQEPMMNQNDGQARLRDEYTIFGEAVANEMRQMSDFRTIQTAFKNKVKKILEKVQETSSFE